jgi:ketol-acid reductoisomerase
MGVRKAEKRWEISYETRSYLQNVVAQIWQGERSERVMRESRNPQPTLIELTLSANNKKVNKKQKSK